MVIYIQKETGAIQKIMWKRVDDDEKYAKDYVISTGNQYTIKEFINLSAKYLRMKITWKGKGLKEKLIGIIKK